MVHGGVEIDLLPCKPAHRVFGMTFNPEFEARSPAAAITDYGRQSVPGAGNRRQLGINAHRFLPVFKKSVSICYRARMAPADRSNRALPVSGVPFFVFVHPLADLAQDAFDFSVRHGSCSPGAILLQCFL